MVSTHPSRSPVQFRRLHANQADRLFAAALDILERTGARLFEAEALALLRRVGVRPTDGNQVRIPAGLVEKALATAPKTVTLFLPQDITQTEVDRYQMEVMLANTTKPIWYVTIELSGYRDAVKMAEAVVGGAQALRERPIAACYINVTTGLVHNQEGLQKLLFLAERGLPFAYVPSAQGGVTEPVTPAGALAGLVLSQLQQEGAPFSMPGWGGNMLDMRTTVQPYADPDKRALAPDLVHHLGLPMFALAGSSNAKVVDGQAAAEQAQSN